MSSLEAAVTSQNMHLRLYFSQRKNKTGILKKIVSFLFPSVVHTYQEHQTQTCEHHTVMHCHFTSLKAEGGVVFLLMQTY